MELRHELWKENNKGMLTLPITGYAQLIRTSAEETRRLLGELKSCGVCEVSPDVMLKTITCNDPVMLLYATAKTFYKDREANRLRVEKHRSLRQCNANVQELTSKLKSCILYNNPKAKIKENQVSGWHREADLLLRVDHRDFEEAVKILAWSQQDSFWKTNILSMGKFRKQYDQLKMKMETATRGATSHSRKSGWEAVHLADRCELCGQTLRAHTGYGKQNQAPNSWGMYCP